MPPAGIAIEVENRFLLSASLKGEDVGEGVSGACGLVGNIVLD
jgi:hypothetical protein